MKIKSAPSIINLIGILLVVVALVSAGGLFYIASEYSKISETLVTVEAEISELRIIRNNSTGEVTISIFIRVDNPSNLDIDIYRIECNTYLDRTPESITAFDRYVGAGSTSDSNGTVHANTVREVPISQVVLPDTIYKERLDYALDGGNELFAYVLGFLWFRVADYPDVTNKLGFVYPPHSPVVMQVV